MKWGLEQKGYSKSGTDRATDSNMIRTNRKEVGNKVVKRD